MKEIYLIILSLIIGIASSRSQNLDDLLEGEMSNQTEYSYATFKATRIVTGHSVERMKKRELDVRISHRFGSINGGPYELFGIDQSNAFLSLEYGINKWIMVALGRGTFDKTFSSYSKTALLGQCSGAKNHPVSIVLVNQLSYSSLKWRNPERQNYYSSRFSYSHQLLIARKFNNNFSLQLTPTFVHRNLVATPENPNDIGACGIGARYKISNRISINLEWYYVINKDKTYTNPLSIGFDIETGGHVFQLHLTNSLAMTEPDFIGKTNESWEKGGIHIGFNISRVFTFKEKQK